MAVRAPEEPAAPRQPVSTSLWRHADFMRLWVAETVSHFGSQVTMLALPWTAILVLNAGPGEMGILGAAERAPFLLVGLFAGVWVDRMRRRRVLVVSDIGRGLLLATVPIAALMNALTMEHLYVVGFLVGILTVFFDVAYQAYLPAVVGRSELVEGNSKLEVSRSAASMLGPGLTGGLVQVLTAPVAIVVDAISFLLSAVFLGQIRAREPDPAPREPGRSIWSEIGEGLQTVVGSRLLRPIAACTGSSNLFGSAADVVVVLYLTRDLALPPALLGLIFGVGSVGFLLGAALAGRVARRFGVGPTIVGSSLLSGLGMWGAPLLEPSTPLPVVVVTLVVAQILVGITIPIYNITQVSLRQAITPHRLLGRMNASMRFLIWGTMPIGALIGGALGELIGTRPALVLAAIGGLTPGLWVLFSPVRHLREQPTPVED